MLAVLDPHRYLLAPMYQQEVGTPNVSLYPKLCQRRGLHVQVKAVRPIPALALTPLIVELKLVKDSHLVAQFDGSCHIRESIGGAGGVIWSPGPVPVILDTMACWLFRSGHV